MLDSAANSVGNIDIISYHVAFPSHMICQSWRSLPLEHYTFWCFLGVLTFYVLDSAANSVGNITLYILVLFGVLTFLVLDSAANSVGNIDIISFPVVFPSQMICKYW